MFSIFLQRSKERLREIELQSHAVEDLLREKNIHLREIDREIGNHQMKIRHACQAVTSIRVKLQNKASKIVKERNQKRFQVSLHIHFQTDIELRIKQERLKVVTSLLGDLITSQPEIDACLLYCQQENVPPPKFTKLTRRKDYGSRLNRDLLLFFVQNFKNVFFVRSSLGSLPSSHGSDRRKKASTGQRRDHHYSSMSSLSSQDSGSSSVMSFEVILKSTQDTFLIL